MDVRTSGAEGASPRGAPEWEGGVSWLPALTGAFICVVLIRIGFLGFFFLVPIGFVAALWNARTVRASVLSAVAFHVLSGLGISLAVPLVSRDFILDILYFGLMVSVFVWIIRPPEWGPGFLRIRASWRLTLGAALGLSVFVGIAVSAGENSGFAAFVRAQSELISSLSIASSGSDAARRSLLEQYLTPDRIRELMTGIVLRGGGLASCMLVFYLSRFFTLFLAALVRKGRVWPGLREFQVSPWLIWVFSLSLGTVLLARLVKWQVPEIAAWNALTACALMYLAQGAGIARHFLTRRLVSPGLRLFINIAIVFAALSPGLNALLFGGLILLGVAEHWVALRALKQEGPPPTPAA
ncbi:MAG: YybS family protein [Treponema sp.]|jgi:hypothetical protein|nr:YybS family protein [Treponema sp.]